MRCLTTLESSLDRLRQSDLESVEYEIYRNAAVNGFEVALETSGKLLRRALKAYSGTPREIDRLTFRDVLRHAARHGLVSLEEVERWFTYRDNRNSTAHDHGVAFAEETLVLLPRFIDDARRLEAVLREKLGRGDA